MQMSKIENYCERIELLLKKLFNYQEEYNFTFENPNNNYNTSYRLDEQSSLLFLANGDVIKYQTPKSCIAHLLGIDTNYLASTGLFTSKDSYGILKEFLNKRYNICNPSSHASVHVDVNKIFSPFMDKKLEAIEENIKMEIHNCEFVCKFDISKSYGYNDNNDMDYLVLSKQDDKYYVLILSKLEKQGDIFYIPTSNQMFDSKEEAYENLNSKLYNQEFTIINCKSLLSKQYSQPRKYFLNTQDKVKKLENLRSWTKNLSCTPDVLNDFIYSLKALNKNKNMSFYQSNLLVTITEKMKQGEIITNEEIENLSDDLKEMVKAYNDSVCNTSFKKHEKTYSSISDENESLKKDLVQAQNDYEKLLANFNELQAKYKDSEAKNNELEGKMVDIRKILG